MMVMSPPLPPDVYGRYRPRDLTKGLSGFSIPHQHSSSVYYVILSSKFASICRMCFFV